MLGYIFVFGVFRSIQWASTGNLAYSDIAPEQLARFSALYYILWQLAVAISVGLAAAMLSLLAGGGPAVTNDFRILFAIEGVITLCALLAYPFAIEPFFTLKTQTFLWSVGFSLLALCIGVAAFFAANGKPVIRSAAKGSRPTLCLKIRSGLPLHLPRVELTAPGVQDVHGDIGLPCEVA